LDFPAITVIGVEVGQEDLVDVLCCLARLPAPRQEPETIRDVYAGQIGPLCHYDSDMNVNVGDERASRQGDPVKIGRI